MTAAAGAPCSSMREKASKERRRRSTITIIGDTRTWSETEWRLNRDRDYRSQKQPSLGSESWIVLTIASACASECKLT